MNNDTAASTGDAASSDYRVFRGGFAQFNKPTISILLGRCYSSAQLSEAKAALVYVEKNGVGGLEACSWEAVREMRAAVRTTRLIDALNKGRKWARKSLAEQLGVMLEPGVAITVVPPHDQWTTDSPIRLLARALTTAEKNTSTAAAFLDAAGCLVRHTAIKRITFGGPSSVPLHLRTIRVENPEIIAGWRVLLLDDIAKSGQSLLACRALLYEAGAEVVQMAALGRVSAGLWTVK